jgi:hypothetical protein
MDRDPFWSEDQRRAFELACDLAQIPVTKAGAESWKRQRGMAFRAWRELSKTERKRLMDKARQEARRG